jgi:D-alanyl-D-alanine carboxypeptidase (penicillin-binding protein 5/6)
MKILLTLAALTLPIFGFAMDISAKSAIIIDAGSGKVLWERDADVLRYPASTTKIMTGMLLLERCLPDDLITAPVGIDKIPPSSMHLKPNEQVSAKDMLYALMLRSANDGAVAVANHVSGSIPAFAELMNERAREIGCRSTHFHNPNGLNDPEHVTTARDLAMIAREAMKYEAFREVVRTRKYQIQRSINQKDLFMVTRNRWLYKDSTADGIKTGYTKDAGNCYVGSATRNGFQVITVILKSDNWLKDNQQMLDWSFKNYSRFMSIHKGGAVASLAVAGGTAASVAAIAGWDAKVVVSSSEPTCEVTEAISNFKAPIKKGQFLTDMILRDGDGFTQKIPLYAGADVPVSKLAALQSAVTNPNGWTVAMGSLMFVGAFVVRGRKRTSYGSKTRKSPF